VAGRLPLAYSLRNVGARRIRTMLTVAVVALVVLAVTLMLSLVSGIRRTLVTTGSPDNLIVLRKGATNDGSSMIPVDAYQAIRYFTGIAGDAGGEPLVSPEMVVQPFFYTAEGGRENVLVRGVRPVAFAVHDNVRIVEGRAMRSSAGEAVVGRALLARYRGIALGNEIEFGRRRWTVVGIFDSAGSAYDSEVWVDVTDLWSDANRSIYSGLRIKALPGADRDALVRRIEGDGRWALEARPEVDYYREQSESANFLYGLTVLLAILMGLGATFGAMNTMFAAVQSRTVEIGTLRALGFSRGSILLSFVAESLAIALAGFVAGTLLAVAATAALNSALRGVAFNLATFSTAVISLKLTPPTVAASFGLAALLGFAGGLVPARRAARLSPVEALRKG
jgi:ABC-type lipoprotein release transport system permease subunit